jgi:nucleoside-diphosphate-sugar epimerase
MRRRVGSNRKARELLGWEAQIGLDDGLRDTVAWIRAHG